MEIIEKLRNKYKKLKEESDNSKLQKKEKHHAYNVSCG